MQELNFGRIERLAVKAGEPIWNPPPRIVREVKFGGDNSPRPEREMQSFSLKSRLVELFRHLDGIASGEIALLEVKHGLPFRMLIER
jgi:hypothetical protein